MGEVVGVAVSNVFIGTCSDATLGVDRRTLDLQISLLRSECSNMSSVIIVTCVAVWVCDLSNGLEPISKGATNSPELRGASTTPAEDRRGVSQGWGFRSSHLCHLGRSRAPAQLRRSVHPFGGRRVG